MKHDTDVLFQEEQQFRQPWLWALMIGVFLIETIVFGYIMFVQLILGHPVGNHPMSNAALMVVGPSTIAVVGGIVWMLYCAKLTTEVRGYGLFIRFFPFHWKFHAIPLAGVNSVQAITYNPVLDYGGWGIRYTMKGKAYNVSGNRGVYLRYEDGRHLLIGSQKPDELAQAINTVLEHGGA